MSRHRFTLALSCSVFVFAAGLTVVAAPSPAAPAPLAADHAGHDDHDHAAPTDAQAAADTLYKAYLGMSDSLSKDAAADASKQLEHIHHAAHRLSDVAGEKAAPIAERIAKAAHDGKTDELKALRTALKAISPGMIELAHTLPPSAHVAPELRHLSCSMAEADWLQVGAKTANPYLGSEMPTCGKLVESIPAKPAASK